MAADEPTISAFGSARSSAADNCLFSFCNWWRSYAFWITTSRSPKGNGLVKKSYAPCFIASTAASIEPWPVSITISQSELISLSFGINSNPDIPGIIKSTTAASNDLRAARSSACAPLAASSTRNPRRTKRRTTVARNSSSSSTTNRWTRSGEYKVRVSLRKASHADIRKNTGEGKHASSKPRARDRISAHRRETLADGRDFASRQRPPERIFDVRRCHRAHDSAHRRRILA